MTRDDIINLVREAGYPLLVYEGKPHLPGYIEKMVLMAYAMGYGVRGNEDRMLFDDWKCPPCNHHCNQGRDCPARR